jgi:hypothetical protein
VSIEIQFQACSLHCCHREHDELLYRHQQWHSEANSIIFSVLPEPAQESHIKQQKDQVYNPKDHLRWRKKRKKIILNNIPKNDE